MPGLPRDEAVQTLDDGYGEIESLVRRLTDDQMVLPATIGGGDWSARDLVGHLTTWEELALEALEQWRQGAIPTVESEIFGSAEGVDSFNARTVEAKRRQTPDEIRDSSVGVHDRLVEEINRMTDEEWNARAPYPTDRRRHLSELLGSILGAPKRPFGHAFAHLEDLRSFVDSLS